MSNKRILAEIFVLIIYLLHQTESEFITSVQGLNARLEQFKSCNIRITAEFENTDFESFQVPVGLNDAAGNSNHTIFLQEIWNPEYGIRKGTLGYQFKYRKESCMLDLIFHLGHGKKHSKMLYEYAGEYMDDKYLVLVREYQMALVDGHKLLFNMNGVMFVDHRVFVWTIKSELKTGNNTNLNLVQNFNFHSILFICESCSAASAIPDTPKVYILEEREGGLR